MFCWNDAYHFLKQILNVNYSHTPHDIHEINIIQNSHSVYFRGGELGKILISEMKQVVFRLVLLLDGLIPLYQRITLKFIFSGLERGRVVYQLKEHMVHLSLLSVLPQVNVTNI